MTISSVRNRLSFEEEEVRRQVSISKGGLARVPFQGGRWAYVPFQGGGYKGTIIRGGGLSVLRALCYH